MFKGHKRRKSIDATRVGKTVEKEEKASPTTEKEQKKLDKLQKKEQKKLSKQQRNSIPKKGPAAGSLVNAENESNIFKSGSPRSNTAAASMLAMTTAQGLTTAINQSGKPAAVFGVDLEELMKLQESFEPKLQVPLLVKECIHYLVRRGMGSEGIFRISAPLSQLVVLKDDFNRQLTTREKVDLERVDNPDIVSSCLKLFLRELPSPLLTFELGTLFCQAMDEKQGEAEKIQQVSSLIEQLPEVNQNILYACLSLLFMVSCNSHHNMMDADNLSLVVGPNMLWSEQGDVSLGHLAKVNTLIRFMIQNLDELFPLPLSSFRLSTEPEMALLRRKMIGHKKSVQCLCHSANHDFVWSADSLGLVRIYDASSVELVNEVSTNMQNIFCMLGNGDNIWIGCPVSIQIRSEESGALLREMSCFCGSLLEVGEHVWAGGDGQVHVFDSKTFDKVDTIQVPPSVLTFAMVLVGEKVWCAGTDNKIRVYNSKSRVLETDYEAQRRKINHMIKVDNTVWSTSDDKTIVVWHADTHEKLATLDSHSGYVYTLTHFGNRVWSCSWDKHILIWDSKTYELLGSLPTFHNDAVSGVISCWNKGLGEWLAWSCSWDRSVCVWSIADCTKPPKLFARDPSMRLSAALLTAALPPQTKPFNIEVQQQEEEDTLLLSNLIINSTGDQLPPSPNFGLLPISDSTGAKESTEATEKNEEGKEAEPLTPPVILLDPPTSPKPPTPVPLVGASPTTNTSTSPTSPRGVLDWEQQARARAEQRAQRPTPTKLTGREVVKNLPAPILDDSTERSGSSILFEKMGVGAQIALRNSQSQLSLTVVTTATTNEPNEQQPLLLLQESTTTGGSSPTTEETPSPPVIESSNNMKKTVLVDFHQVIVDTSQRKEIGWSYSRFPAVQGAIEALKSMDEAGMRPLLWLGAPLDYLVAPPSACVAPTNNWNESKLPSTSSAGALRSSNVALGRPLPPMAAGRGGSGGPMLPYSGPKVNEGRRASSPDGRKFPQPPAAQLVIGGRGPSGPPQQEQQPITAATNARPLPPCSSSPHLSKTVASLPPVAAGGGLCPSLREQLHWIKNHFGHDKWLQRTIVMDREMLPLLQTQCHIRASPTEEQDASHQEDIHIPIITFCCSKEPVAPAGEQTEANHTTMKDWSEWPCFFPVS